MSLDAIQPLLDAMDGVAYLTDASGAILAVGRPGWDGFARPHGAVAAEEMVGRNLFEAMRGEPVRQAYADVHRVVLAGERPWVSFEYRCDSPELARRMRMSISRVRAPEGAQGLLHQSQLLSATPRPWMSLFEPDRIVESLRAETSLSIVNLCGFCQRVAWPSAQAPAEWIAPEIYYQRGGEADVRVSHGVCPECTAHL